MGSNSAKWPGTMKSSAQSAKAHIVSAAKTSSKPQTHSFAGRDIRDRTSYFLETEDRAREGAKMVVKPNTTPDLEPLRELIRHHIESFDYLVDKGLEIVFQSIKGVHVHDSFINKNLRNILFYSSVLFLCMSKMVWLLSLALFEFTNCIFLACIRCKLR